MKERRLVQNQRIVLFIIGVGCVFFLLAAGVYAAFIGSLYPSHTASTNSWVENFDGNSLNRRSCLGGTTWHENRHFQSSFWDVSNGAYSMGAISTLHQGYFQPDHVSVSGGYLILTLTQEKGQVGSNPNGVISRGGEIATQKAYGYGTYEWRMRTSSTASSPTDTTGKVVSGQISAGFTYINNSQSELDFEVEGQYPDTAEMTTWDNTHPSTDPTGNDQIETSANVSNMASEFKIYKLVWSAGEVKYYVDNTLVADHTSHVPSVAANVLVNHWGTDSTDFGGMATVGTTRYMLVDWIRYTAPGDTPIAIGVPTPDPASPNLLKNGSFENTTLSAWCFVTTGSASGSTTIDKTTYSTGTASAMIKVSRGNRRSVWYIQFGQVNVPFSGGDTYTITFWAKASASRTGQLYIQLDAEYQ